MRTQRVWPGTRLGRWAHDLYRRAFPPEEQLPWALLHLASLRLGVDLRVWFDDRERGQAARAPVALTWTLRSRRSDRVLHLFYLAVDDSARGRGVGSRLLADLVRRHPGWTIVADIEPVVPEAPNAQQRSRRLAFYQKAGFTDTGYSLVDPTGEYWTLARIPSGSGEFDAAAVRRNLRLIGLGAVSLQRR